MRRAASLVPGLTLLFALGLLARLSAALIPQLNYLIVAILFGVFVGNSFGVPDWARSGVQTHDLWLKSGIILMGGSVAFDHILAAGPVLLVLVVGTVVATLVIVEGLASRLFAVREKTRSLLAAGSSICGVSAVIAIGGSIEADEDEIAYAAATVLLFDAVTLLLYPVVGHALALSDTVFGLWAGLTMFSTGPVTAAGFAFSETAGKWALLAKLTRNALIGVVAIGYALYYAPTTEGEADGILSIEWNYLWSTFPTFVLGFLAVMVLANTGVLSAQHIRSLGHASNWLFLLAFVGLGLEMQLAKVRSTGLAPVLVVLLSVTMISLLVLFVLVSLF